MIIEILFIVFWVIGVFLWYPWPGMPSWSLHAYMMIMFALTGLALFDGLFGGGHVALVR
jgi:hypothetical protein